MNEVSLFSWRRVALLLLTVACFSAAAGPNLAIAEDATAATTEVVAKATEVVAKATEVVANEVPVSFVLSNLWIMLAGMLVFIMHLGFSALESGLTRSKNTVNILFKNAMIVCIGIMTYGVIGFSLMYPSFEDSEIGIVKIGEEGFGFLLNGADEASLPEDATPAQIEAFNKTSTPEYYADYTKYTDFFFQAMFAATCCTIVSGAVAGRVKLSSFLIFCTFFVTISYPITGSWQWGGGWLARFGFHDFAGSTLVHSVGGWAALVMAILLGPRMGKYVNGRPVAIAPSNLPMAAVGVFLLWFGWFGFNGGSVLSADPGLVSLVLVNTTMAAAAGGFVAAMTSWVHAGKPDLSMSLNGILAGLVGITAGADKMSGLDALIIGAIAGILVYFAVIFIDSKLKIDDPVGAVSVHLVCGIWGTLAVGLFGQIAGGEQLIAQLVGIASIGAFTVLFALIVGFILKATMGLSVGAEEEHRGLDLSEHGIKAYSLH